jgi:hypothetical protein
MAQRVFFLNTLRDGVAPSDYEHWVRTVDYPIARRQVEIKSYVVTRLEGHLSRNDALPCQYLEVLEVTDVDDYRSMIDSSAEFQGLMDEFSKYVGATVAVYGEVIDD